MKNVIQRAVPLAPLTSFELGGPAEYFLRAESERDVVAGLRWAKRRGVPVRILGGGSNLVIPDEGVGGLVVQMATRGRELKMDGDLAELTVAAGESWDPLVAWLTGQDLVGFECLSGIPGSVGATPIQNVGAYGHEVADSLIWVRVLDRETLEDRLLTSRDCDFGYRDSRFKRDLDRFVVLSVRFALRRGAVPEIRYAELERAVAERAETKRTEGSAPTASEVREIVIGLRKRKSMVFDPDDENRRCAGSFFTNPIIEAADADRVVRDAVERGLVSAPSEVPRYAAGDGKSKLAAGWLIERAGLCKGTRRGAFGISSKHALALVHHGGGQTRDLMAFAEEVQGAVRERFGVELHREPTLWA